MVEYTADAKNGFQAVVKKFGHSHHPDTVTHHMNHGHQKHHLQDGSSGGYAPNYYTGGGGGGAHYESPAVPQIESHHGPPAYANHYDEPPTAFDGYGGHYYHQPASSPHAFGDYYHQPGGHHNVQYETGHAHGNQYRQPPPSTYNHYEPAIGLAHYEPPVVPAYYGPAVVPAHYEPPVVPAHYEPSATSNPDIRDFDQSSPSSSPFAGNMPTAHGDYGSAPQKEYYPGPLRFPATSGETGFDWPIKTGSDEIGPDGYNYPAVEDGNEHQAHGKLQGDSQERPEYLRKYFEPDHHHVNNFYNDDDDE